MDVNIDGSKGFRKNGSVACRKQIVEIWLLVAIRRSERKNRENRPNQRDDFDSTHQSTISHSQSHIQASFNASKKKEKSSDANARGFQSVTMTISDSEFRGVRALVFPDGRMVELMSEAQVNKLLEALQGKIDVEAIEAALKQSIAEANKHLIG